MVLFALTQEMNQYQDTPKYVVRSGINSSLWQQLYVFSYSIHSNVKNFENHKACLHKYRYVHAEVFSQLINDVTLKYPETLKPHAFECTGQRKNITQ